MKKTERRGRRDDSKGALFECEKGKKLGTEGDKDEIYTQKKC